MLTFLFPVSLMASPPHAVVQSRALKTACFQRYSLRLLRPLMMPQDISRPCTGEERDLFCHWGNAHLVFSILIFILLLVAVRLCLCPAMATLLGHPRRSGLLFPRTPALGRGCSVSHLSDLSLLRSQDDSAVHPRDSEFQRLVLFHWRPPFLNLLPVPSPRCRPSPWSLLNTGSVSSCLLSPSASFLVMGHNHPLYTSTQSTKSSSSQAPGGYLAPSALDLLFPGFQSWKGPRLLVFSCLFTLPPLNSKKMQESVLRLRLALSLCLPADQQLGGVL